MKKTIVKWSVFALTFLVALLVTGKVINKGHNNLTMEMANPTLPVLYMECKGEPYNQLFGYTEAMDVAFMRDTFTLLGENRNVSFTLNAYGNEIERVSIEVRSADGDRLIENTEVTNVHKTDEGLAGEIVLKDLIEKNTEYSLGVIVQTSKKEVAYYTRVIWSDKQYLNESMSFVKDFHEKLYDKEQARELTRYLETNGQLEKNQTFYKVNIHSSFQQITWGDLNVREKVKPTVRLTGVNGQISTFVLDYVVSTGSGKSEIYYQVNEYFRVRYTTDRMYLLDYERTMEQLPQVKKMSVNDKLILGIADENVQMMESEDGNIVVFEHMGQLYSYNAVSNKIARIFSFYEENTLDVRTLHREHDIKILNVDEGGNIWYAVYGYMSRGRHEGQVGIQVNQYNSELNTVEEAVYIPYDKTYAVLKADLGELLYMNRDGQLYFFEENGIHAVNLTERSAKNLVKITQDDSLRVSENNKIAVWQEGKDVYNCSYLNLQNLGSDSGVTVEVPEDEAIRPLGFMGEDMIYGVAKKEDIIYSNSGNVFFPMYKVCICNSEGIILKEYSQPNIYMVDCEVDENQITLKRVKRTESGEYESTNDDHIMDNTEVVPGRNVVATADIGVYERYVQIKTRSAMDAKTLKILQPKEVLFEGGRSLEIETTKDANRYYVYGAYGVDRIFNAPSNAVLRAYELPGVVVDENGNSIWAKGNRVTKNQIMAIKEAGVTEDKNSLAVCLDTILNFEGLMKNSAYLLSEGKTVLEILEESLDDYQILDLTGCNLDSVLYYVNQDIPVLAMLSNGEAVLVTGFNEFNVVIMEPATGTLYKKGMKDSTEWFAENGNRFITYMR